MKIFQRNSLQEITCLTKREDVSLYCGNVFILLKNNIVCSVIIAVMQWWVTLNCSSLPSVSNRLQIHTHRINFRCLNII